MDFLKRAADALTYKDERAAREAEHRAVASTTTTTIETTPGLVASSTTISGEAEITTMKAATVDVVERAPVVEETVIQEQRESMSNL